MCLDSDHQPEHNSLPSPTVLGAKTPRNFFLGSILNKYFWLLAPLDNIQPEKKHTIATTEVSTDISVLFDGTKE